MRLSLATRVEQYVLGTPMSQPVSTAEAVVRIRQLVPDAEVTDRELADLVAGVAVRNQRAVNFDPLVAPLEVATGLK